MRNYKPRWQDFYFLFFYVTEPAVAVYIQTKYKTENDARVTKWLWN